jgi:peptidoglycan/LPS O-acetylase OafA/YrhL
LSRLWVASDVSGPAEPARTAETEPPGRPSAERRYRPDVDGLRAVAVLPVLIYHLIPSWAPGGFTGVDIFFVISGFVIAGSIRDDLDGGKFSVKYFYFKRIKRILPALFATVVVTTAAAVIILLPEDLDRYGGSLAATSAFVSNIFFWRTSGYFEAAAQTQPLLHTWSLAVEEQYYLVAPVAFSWVSRWGGRRWLLFLGPILLLSFGVSVAAVFVGPTAGYFLLPSRLWELLLGALLALSGGKPRLLRWVREAVGLLGLALVAWGIVALREGDAFPGWNAVYPCVGAALIIQAGTLPGAASAPLVSRILSAGPVVWIGRISYSLYLVHWPIAALHKYLTMREPTLAEAVVMLATCMALAWLSWRFIEQPLRRTGRERLPFVLAAQLLAICVGVAAGFAIMAMRGLPSRFPGYVERRIPGIEQWGGAACFNENPTQIGAWSLPACTRIHGSNGRILVWGDSFAAQYMPGVLLDRSRIDADVIQYTFAGCPPILAYFSYARVGCAPFNRRALDIVNQDKIDTVVLAARWTDVPRHDLDNLGQTVATLRRLGARVFVIGQSPMFVADVQHIDFLSGLAGDPGVVEWPVAFDPKLNDELMVRSAGATFINPISYLCSGSLCPYREGATFFYADYGHFSTYGSLRATAAYFPAGVRSR